jgi:phthiocerol/phenolphthiocerol synthesis type-I polyketide synthase C
LKPSPSVKRWASADALSKPLPIGSVKSNMGHLETASGVAGLVKALHCIQHRVVPATIGVEHRQSQHQARRLEPGPGHQQPLELRKAGKLIIGVNSFGFGGANAHVILESPGLAQASVREPASATPLPLVVSARDSTALQAAAREFADFLSGQSADACYDIAYSAAFHREWHEQRAVVYGSEPQLIAEALRDFAEGHSEQATVETGSALPASAGPAFIYSGNGSQWAGMGQRLLAEDPLFRATIREIDALFQRHADFSIADELAGENGAARYAFTEVAQPALFAMQVGITQMLRHRVSTRLSSPATASAKWPQHGLRAR